MRRSAASTESDAVVREQATHITHLMAGIVRFSFEQSLGSPVKPPLPDRLARLPGVALEKLVAR